MGIKLVIELARPQDGSRKQGKKEGKECENEGIDNEGKVGCQWSISILLATAIG